MIELNISFLIQMANFLVLLVLLNFVLYRPIRGIIKERREKMDSLAAEAEKFQQKTTQTREEMEEVLRQARADGLKRVDGFKNEGHEEEASRLTSLNQEVETETAKANTQIKEQMAKARDALLEQVDEFSLTLAEKLLGRSLA